jgi:hypothetical protein
MFLIGSHAAHLFPYDFGRDVADSDIDLLGQREEGIALYDTLGLKTRTHLVEHPGYLSIIRLETVRQKLVHPLVGLRIIPKDLIALMGALTDNKESEIFGFPVKVVSPVTNYIIRRSLIGIRDDKQKYFEDAAYLKRHAYLGYQVTQPHIDFFRGFRKFVSSYSP